MRIFLALLLLSAYLPVAAQTDNRHRKAGTEDYRDQAQGPAIEPITIKIPAVIAFRVEAPVDTENNLGISCYGNSWRLESPLYYIYLNNVFLPDEVYINYLHARLSRQEIMRTINSNIISIKHLTGEELAGKYPALPQGVWLIKARARRLTKAIKQNNAR
jgi:hypothetical protein